jgi:hypothetical protein
MLPRVAARDSAGTHGAHARMDLIALGIVAAFFVASWGFVLLCERL